MTVLPTQLLVTDPHTPLESGWPGYSLGAKIGAA
jgi:hypothetical protein